MSSLLAPCFSQSLRGDDLLSGCGCLFVGLVRTLRDRCGECRWSVALTTVGPFLRFDAVVSRACLIQLQTSLPFVNLPTCVWPLSGWLFQSHAALLIAPSALCLVHQPPIRLIDLAVGIVPTTDPLHSAPLRVKVGQRIAGVVVRLRDAWNQARAHTALPSCMAPSLAGFGAICLAMPLL